MYINKLLQSSILIVVLGIWGQNLSAQTVKYAENAQKKGFQLQQSRQNAFTLDYNVSSFSLHNVTIEGQKMQHVSSHVSTLPAEAGMPDLPSASTYLLIPKGAQVQLSIVSEKKEVYNNMDIAPAAPLPFENQEAIAATKGRAYQQDAFFPQQRYIASTTEVRGMTLAHIAVAPFSYNPISKQLIVYKNVQLKIDIIGGKGQYAEPRFRSKYWDPIISDMILNKKDLPQANYTHKVDNSKTAGCEYLIISPDQADFLQWADSIKRFRNEQGIHTKVVSMSEVGSNTVDNIKTYVQNVYNTWNPVPAGILLMADYGSDNKTISSKSYPHPYSGTYITDNYYADCSGNDLPDITFARMTARNASELEVMIKKFLGYERTPPTNSDFYNKPITALGWQTERWFQICSEVVGGYMKNKLGKNPTRINAIYDGNPASDPWSSATNTNQVLNYFGPGGQNIIPATPGELGGWTGGTATDVVNALNAGAFMLQHRDHGNEDGWGEPGFSNTYVSQLNNTDKLSHIFSINCLTGRFDMNGECFAEKMHRYANGGALSLTAATQVSYSFVNDTYVWGMFDNMWPDLMPDNNGPSPARDFLPSFGSVAGKYFLSASDWPYNSDSKQITYRLFHHHGDAFNTVYTEQPQNLNPTHEDVAIIGNNTIAISNLPEGALIGLSVDGELIGKGMADANGSANVAYTQQTPGSIIKIVITKQNFFRYQTNLTVISPEGPYIIKNGFGIRDASGNNNQKADYDEDITLNFTIKNVGSGPANNVVISISTDDEYVSISDATEDFGAMAADQVVEKENAFAMHIANNIPDQHNIIFNYNISNAKTQWQGNFSINANAPVLKCTLLQAEEEGGNANGTIDPGETAKLTFTIENRGHSASVAGTATLNTNSEHITLNTTEQAMNSIAVEANTTLMFTGLVDAESTLGTFIPLHITGTAGEYQASGDFGITAGLLMEGWETGDMNKFPWLTNGNTDWAIATDQAYEGAYSIKSGAIGNNQISTLSLSHESSAVSSISFRYKVSSEASYDKLKFYIDDTEQGTWDGEVDWSEASYEVAAGSHTFKWEYKKDVSTVGGSDCAWVDNIILPPNALPMVSVGDDMEACASDGQHQLNATADNYNSLEWSTSGDGTFSASDILNPIYTFGTQDIATGQAQLKLKATGSNGIGSSSMLLNILSSPETPNIVGAEHVCQATQEEEYILGTTTNGTYSCTLNPADAATITVVGNKAKLNFAEGFSGNITLTATASNTCGSSTESSLTINVNSPSTAAFNSNSLYACNNTTAAAQLIIAGNEAAPWQVVVNGDGGYNETFNVSSSPFDIELPANANPTNYSIASITDANGCSGQANSSTVVNTTEAIPLELGAHDSICQEATITLNAPVGEGYTYLWSNGATTASLTVDYSMATNEIATVGVEVTNSQGCTATDETQIKFKDCVGIEEYEANKIILMPNPNNGSFILDLSALQNSIESIAIYNSTGAKVADVSLQQGAERISIEQTQLMRGMYFLRLTTHNGLLIHKAFIVQ